MGNSKLVHELFHKNGWGKGGRRGSVQAKMNVEGPGLSSPGLNRALKPS